MALEWARHDFWIYASQGGVIGEKIENLALKSVYEAVLDLSFFVLPNMVPLTFNVK